MSSATLTATRFLTVARVTNRWIFVTWALFAAFVIWVRLEGDTANVAPYFFFFLVPVAAGTGVLSCARRGELDLLFGSGQDRFAVWRTAAVRGIVIPIVLAELLLALTGPLEPKATLIGTAVRLLCVLIFTSGLSYAAGLVDPKFVLPVVWMLIRILFIMVPAGLAIVVAIGKDDLPSYATLSLASVVIPEICLDPNMPLTFPVALALIGTGAIAGSWQWFRRSDLGGKRS